MVANVRVKRVTTMQEQFILWVLVGLCGGGATLLVLGALWLGRRKERQFRAKHPVKHHSRCDGRYVRSQGHKL